MPLLGQAKNLEILQNILFVSRDEISYLLNQARHQIKLISVITAVYILWQSIPMGNE